MLGKVASFATLLKSFFKASINKQPKKFYYEVIVMRIKS